MFEGGKIRRGDAGGESVAPVRELRWTELVAQLAATRDLRGEHGRKAGESGGASGRFKSLNVPFADAPVRGNDDPTATHPTGQQRLTPSEPTGQGMADTIRDLGFPPRQATRRTPRDRESS